MEATGGIWGEVERSESYLVCSMYEEAESLSSSILKQILGNIDVLSEEALGDHQLFHDMLESAGMVLVQSLHGLGRTGEIVTELRQVFGEVAAIPLQVLLTGICLQISNGSYSSVREILEDNHYILDDAKVNAKGLHGDISLGIDEYMEAVELYTFGVLAKDTKDMGLAVSWVEKAALPEETRQGLLRRLHSLLSLKSANVPEATSFEENSSYDVVNNNKSLANDEVDYVLKLSKQHEPWSSRPLSLRLGNTRFSISRGKVALSLVGLIICYALKRKRAALVRIIRRQMESTKKAIVDFWKLAFSYQVNPLAAIQSIPSTTT
ncbi:PREDICTED: uncharacterized protein LOC106332717 [Brassica oleracea var. oleracea]|uniref:Uncharacterized protein n=2 Tax=Brassica oleracea TaxID=3712 RepID=A0A0D3BAL3_BRAOL|nr:PREDICTED: uncharacterized protein LOC106332717 [Brassica oleracea var. oleracea]VDC93163.1 unnamed protein product [Brassica oleracea]